MFQPGRRLVRVAALAAAALALCLPAAAEEKLQRDGHGWVLEEHGVLPVARSVRVLTGVGNVTIDSNGTPFTYTVRKRSQQLREQDARRQFGLLKVTASRRATTSVLQGDWPRVASLAAGFSADFVIHVPKELDLVLVDTLSGNVTVTSSAAKLDLGTRGGNIEVNEAFNLVKVRTLGGNVSINHAGNDVLIRSGGGNIRLGAAHGRVEVVSMGGNIWMHTVGSAKMTTAGSNIEIQQSRGDVFIENTGGGGITLGEVGGSAHIDSGGGNIRLGSVHGRVVASTANGNIEMWKVAGGAQAQSVAGTITAEFIGSRDSFSESYLHTNAGDIVVYLTKTTPANVQATSEMAHRQVGIRSEFPLNIVSEGSGVGPKTTYAEGSVNGGGPLLRVRTSIGQIDFRKAK